MTIRTPAALLAALLALSAIPAVAQEAPPPPVAGPDAPGGGEAPHGRFLDFGGLDADGDGRITREEIAAARRAAIAGLDANGDGVLTAEEILAFRMAREQARVEAEVRDLMTARDLNGDGRLGADELMAGLAGPMGRGFGAPGLAGLPPGAAERVFARVDRDGDGAITRAEAEAARERMARGHDDWRGRGEGKGDGPGRHHRPHGPDRAMERGPGERMQLPERPAD